MNRCLCCQQPVNTEKRRHPRCLKRLFDTTRTPDVPLSVPDLGVEMRRRAAGKMSISGMQAKAPVCFNRKTGALEVAGTGSTHVLKPELREFPELPQNENLCMNIAESLCMEVPPHGLFFLSDGTPAYLIRRYDRGPNGEKRHQEDMAQLLELDPEAKYSGSLESVGRVIFQHVKNPHLDLIRFLERILLNFILGNGDMHLKNWSLLEHPDGRKELAPCYDFVCTELYLPGEDESALTIQGKRNRLKRTHFEKLAAHLDMDPKAVDHSFERLLQSEREMLACVRESELSPARQEAVTGVIRSRLARLS